MYTNLNNFNVMSQIKETKEINEEVSNIVKEMREKFSSSTIVNAITHVEDVNTCVDYAKNKERTTYKLTDHAILNNRGSVEIGNVVRNKAGEYLIYSGLQVDNSTLGREQYDTFRIYINPGEYISYYDEYISVIGQRLTKRQAFHQVLAFLAKQEIKNVNEVFVLKDDKKAHYSGIEKLGTRYEVTEEALSLAS